MELYSKNVMSNFIFEDDSNLSTGTLAVYIGFIKNIEKKDYKNWAFMILALELIGMLRLKLKN